MRAITIKTPGQKPFVILKRDLGNAIATATALAHIRKETPRVSVVRSIPAAPESLTRKARIASHVSVMTEWERRQCIEWVLECSWCDVFCDEDAEELTNYELVSGIERNYYGGYAQFLEDAVTV